jgi:predicted DNA-binding protein (MmcQ/YjbR family)
VTPYQRIHKICLALPEAEERLTWEVQTFRIRDKIFAMFGTDEGPRVSCKAPPGAQEVLIGADPARFYKPAYVGPKGWIGIRLDDSADWAEIASLIERSYRMTAPKKLLASLSPAAEPSRPARRGKT